MQPVATARLTRTPSEQCQKVFDLLLAVNKHFNAGTTLRVAGGWVRDQLIGIEANDVDIAVESPAGVTTPVTGADFANMIKEYQESQGLDKSTVSVVKTNPDKSKHIETAQITLYKLQIEFCHLRADDYTQNDSRIPVVRPGTPLEDAQRRDFTVNALYYNLHSQMVEDFTSGLVDMEKKVLRCPLAPLETFLDDPLRLLRGIRFAGQLSYHLDESILQCVREFGPTKLIPVIESKISRERIGIEVGKMFGRKDPMRCVDLLHHTQLMYATLLCEHYYLSTKNGKTSLGGPVKSIPTPTAIYPTLPNPLHAAANNKILSEDQLADFHKFSAMSFERGTIWLTELLRSLTIPRDDPRVAVSFFTFLAVPLIHQEKNMAGGCSYPRQLFNTGGAGDGEQTASSAVDPKSESEIYRSRLAAILSYAMKLPSRNEKSVAKMLDAYCAMESHWSRMVGDAVDKQQEDAKSSGGNVGTTTTTTTGSGEGDASPAVGEPTTTHNHILIFQGGRREGVYEALRLLSDEDPSLLQVVLATLAMEAEGGVAALPNPAAGATTTKTSTTTTAGGVSGGVVVKEGDEIPSPTDGSTGFGDPARWYQQYKLVSHAISSDKCLHELLKNGPRIKGNLLGKELNVENKLIGQCVEWQKKFLLHNPFCSDEEIYQFVRTKLGGGE